MRQVQLTMLVSVLLLGSCSKPAESTYRAFSVSVIDEKTHAPIPGAKILTPCMGLSPYPTNTYVTDVSGKARVMYYTGFLAVNVSATGYSNSTVAFFDTNQVALVKLRKID